ncbi:MAG: outer membrane lipoprotein carrier protein LolA [Opitutales bacterium]|nr:outer membrane lipoprotein carrier protein LolA [Opitutales bacterium]
MTKIINFIALVCLVPAMPIFAEPVPAGQVLKLIPQNRIVAGDFEQTKTMLDLEIDLKSAGKFVFSKNDGALWQTDVPAKATILISKESLTFFDKEDKIVQEIKIGASAMAQEIVQIINDAMLGDVAALEKYFELNAQTENGGWRLELSPKESSLPFSAITICGNGGEVSDIHFLNDSKDESTHIKLKNIQRDRNESLEAFKKFEK